VVGSWLLIVVQQGRSRNRRNEVEEKFGRPKFL
jgi:hypothetical protein